MPARITLGTTVLARTLSAGASVLQLASTAGVFPGKYLYFDGELCRAVALVPDGVKVLRGQDGTPVLPHASNVTVYIGDGNQFYQTDPVGRPPETFEVSPWINVQNGKVWFAQGDNDPVGIADRWWQLQTTVYDQGGLGVATKTLNPTSST